MIIDKEPQHLTVSDIFQWLKARQSHLNARSQSLAYDHSKTLDQRELAQIEQRLQDLRIMADACVSGHLPQGLEDLVNDEDYKRENPVQHGLLSEDLAQFE